MSTSALLVPCYNAQKYLPRLREQVDRLAPAFDEVLLADDASTDDTATLAEAMGFRILRLAKNLGPGGARNFLARSTSCDWIHFHDVDDEMASDYLTRISAGGLEDCDAVFHFTDFIDEGSRRLLIRWQFSPDRLQADPGKELLSNPLPTMCSYLRRSFFLDAGGFDEKHRCFEDGDLHFRLAIKGGRIHFLPEVLEWGLRHDQGAGSNQHYCFCCRLDFLESYAATLPGPFHPLIALEAEKTAIALLREKDYPNVKRAIGLAQKLGHAVPSSNHVAIKTLRPFIPADLLLRWQLFWRTRQSS